MKPIKHLLIIATVLASVNIFADAPVVEGEQTQEDNGIAATSLAATDTASLSLEQRIARLEQQATNFTQMNSASRMDQLQQQVSQLQGQLEEQAHQLQQLQDQQKSFYQDIDQRLNALKTVSPANKVSASPADSAAEQKTYQQAFALLSSKKYDDATTGLKKYLAQYPQGKYASNAHYWLGEIYFLQNKPDLSRQEFQTVLTQYPQDQKIPDAMLKLAFIDDNAGKHSQAKQALQKIIKQFPDSSAAQLAKLRLKSLNVSAQ